MKVLGLVAEYNPFHNGHKYHLENSKDMLGADYVVCVLSGNFIQRGEPALLNKWARAKMALLSGVDLVIELPAAYTLQSAEFFAFGAVKILDSLGIINNISFGSELGEIDALRNIASILVNEPPEVSLCFKGLLDSGISFAKAREKAVIQYLSHQYSTDDLKKIMGSPNNILAIEYMKALIKLNSSIKPSTIKRFKTGYHFLEGKDEIASATAIRNMLQQKNGIAKIKPYLPPSSYELLMNEINAGRGPIFTEDFDSAILTQLRKLNATRIKNYPDVNEGLENRIIDASIRFGTYEEVVEHIKTKRYTRTRIQRILFNILLEMTRDMLHTFQQYNGPQYIRVLGMNENGKKLLKLANKRASLPIITKPASYKQSCNPLLKQMIELDFLATDLYTLHFPAKIQRKGMLDLLTSPVIM
ncbi:MAG: nucleotidyltransferase [Clostridia bacterium]